jgi:D-alanine-D-alanine ligase
MLARKYFFAGAHARATVKNPKRRNVVKIALLFNARPPAGAASSPAVPDDAFEEYDDTTTIDAVVKALAPFGCVERVDADATLACRLTKGAFDFAFNIAEGRGRRGREAHAAAVCEMLNLPSTHSDAVTLGITLDKALARRVVAPDVRVPAGILVEEADDVPPALSLRFPVVVKPNDEGSSKGIRDDSVALDAPGAHRLVTRLRQEYRCPVLIEEYLSGAEVTVAVVGNGADARVLGMMEIAPTSLSTQFLYSVEAKRAFRERVRYFMPPRVSTVAARELHEFSLCAYRLLGCRDVARFDFRLDDCGRPHFLECNPLPGLNPDTSDLVILSRDILPYDELVRGIFVAALRRYDMSPA